MQIKVDEHEGKIFALVEGLECVLNFRATGDALDYYRTFVPDNLRGRGIAGQIVLFGLNYAKEKNKKVIPTCGFVRSYIDEHPEWSSIARG